MHLPMRCFVSESQRGDIAPGEESAFDERRAVEESVRMEEGVRLMLVSRRNALRGGAAVVFMARSKPLRRGWKEDAAMRVATAIKIE